MFIFVCPAMSHSCLVCLKIISLNKVQCQYMLSYSGFSNCFFTVRPSVLDKVLVVKCQRATAKCWSGAAFKVWYDLWNISSYTDLLSLKKSEVNNTTKFFLFFCVWTQIVAFTVFCCILNKFLTYPLRRTIVGQKNAGSGQFFSSSVALGG